MAKTLIGNIKGPKGDTGEQGLQGVQGIKGETGQRGSRWSVGTVIDGIFTEPTAFPDMGVEDNLIGDMYLNPDTGHTYRCTESGDAATAKWVWIANLASFDGGLDELKAVVNGLGTDLETLQTAVTNLGPDTTLSVSGKAADAKAVGNKFTSVEADITSVQNNITDIETAFQDGCDTIVSGCTTYGSTPSSNSPDDIVTAIAAIHTARYNAGVNAVKNNPTNYGLSRVAFINGSANLDFVPDGVFAIKDVNDSPAFHWIDNPHGISKRVMGYNGDPDKPSGPTISGTHVTCCGMGVAYKY